MGNAMYVKGRKKEYKIVKHYRDLGYIAHRTAGSHGPFDVIAINKTEKLIKFVQAKTGNISDSEYKKILMENYDLNGIYTCEFILD